LGNRFLARLAMLASFFALGVIALGAYTRLIDAGLGCPDWPECYGHMLVPQAAAGTPVVAYKAWAEMLHRYFVGGLSLFIIAIVISIFSQKMLRHKANIIFALLLVLLLSYQIMLGQWTVTLKLWPVIVTQHLLGGFLILMTLWLIYLNNNEALKMRVPAAKHCCVLGFALIGLLLLGLQILLGAWTSTNYAAFSCAGFPFCHNAFGMNWNFSAAFNPFSTVGINYDGGVLPESARETIQMVHRSGALVVTVYWVLYAMFALPRLKRSFELAKTIYVILALLCVQLSLGITNIILKLPLLTAIAHNLTAVLLLLAITTYIFKLFVGRMKVGV
jgi:heme a synthase